MDLPLESSVERRFKREVKKLGGRAIKLIVIKDDPDRLVLLPYGVCLLVELKRPRGVPRNSQQRRHVDLAKLGHDVVSFDGVEWEPMLRLMRRRVMLAKVARGAPSIREVSNANLQTGRRRTRKRSCTV